MASRPLATVYGLTSQDGKLAKEVSTQVPIPAVFRAPMRDDIVSFVHDQMRRNKRQAHGVSKKAGVQCSAASWGTGRAVARIPRVNGGGSHRSGQGAYGNMCRGGHTFDPLVTYRRWHRKINLNQKRFAMASALAASCLPSLVMARGHSIDDVDEIPLVLDDMAAFLREMAKTKDAVNVLKAIGGYADVEKCIASRRIRPGQGKMRNRRYIMKKGPLLIHTFDKTSSFVKSFRNIPGVDLMHVNRLNLLKVAPGGHLGRFIIWTKSAFEALDSLFGDEANASSAKKGYVLPRSLLSMPDISKVVNSTAVQKVLRDKKPRKMKSERKVNPFGKPFIMDKLNPFATALRRKAILRKRAAEKKRAVSAPV